MKLLGEQARFWAQTLRDTEAFLHPHKVRKGDELP